MCEGRERRGQVCRDISKEASFELPHSPVSLPFISSISGVWAPSPGHTHYCTQPIQETFFHCFHTKSEGSALGNLSLSQDHLKGSQEKKVEYLL